MASAPPHQLAYPHGSDPDQLARTLRHARDLFVETGATSVGLREVVAQLHTAAIESHGRARALPSDAAATDEAHATVELLVEAKELRREARSLASGSAREGAQRAFIPEVVEDGHTGLLVPYDESAPAAFAAGLAARISELLADPDRAAAMGAAGRERVLAEFGWPAIARRTVDVYRQVLAARG